MGRIVVTRDGQDVSPVLPDENAAHAWLLRHQGQSIWWATTHDGYAFRGERRYDDCDDTCTTDCGHCKGQGRPEPRVGA